MIAFKPSTIVAAACLLLSPQVVSACVSFDLNVAYFGDFPFYGTLNAALTDNGEQTCALSDAIVPDSPTGVVELACVGGYSALFNFDNGDVHYAYGSFSGDFGTNKYYDANRNADYWVANVWGC